MSDRRHSPTDDLRDLRAVFDPQLDLSSQARTVAAVLISRRNGRTGQCDPSIPMLARQASISERQVYRALDELEAASVVTKQVRPGRSTTYQVNPPTTPATQSGVTDSQGYPCHTVRGGVTDSQGTPATQSPKRTKERTKERTKGSAGDDADAIRELFEHWQQASGHDRAKLLDERRRKIRARLRTYSVDELKAAISAACADPFYQGQNDRGKRYDWIEIILKNDAKVEQHLDAGGGDEAHSDPLVMTTERLRDWDGDS